MVARRQVTGASGKCGPAILFLHGFMGEAAEWRATMAQLGPAYHCLAVNLPGHGPRSREPGSQTLPALPALARHLVHTAQHLGSDRPVWLVGYSLGARVALYALLHHPEAFAGAFLEGVNPGLADPAERQARLAQDHQWAERLRREDFVAVLRDWYAQPVFANLAQQPALLAATIARRARQEPLALAAALEAFSLGTMPDLWPGLLASTKPIGLLTGAADRKFCAIADRIVAQRPATRRWTVPDCGHNVHLEKPPAYHAALLAFLPAPTAPSTTALPES